MASDPTVIEALDALHVEIDGLRSELAAAVQQLAETSNDLEAERELVELLTVAGGRCPSGEVAVWRRQIVNRLAGERAFSMGIELFLAEYDPKDEL